MADPAAGRAVSIIVPTPREAPNIRALARRVEKAMSHAGLDWELVLVDDDSRDGIDAVVADLSRTLPVRIEVRRDGPRDLSKSVLRGFEVARFDRLVVMDADLSHPPEVIPGLALPWRTAATSLSGADTLPGEKPRPAGLCGVC